MIQRVRRLLGGVAAISLGGQLLFDKNLCHPYDAMNVFRFFGYPGLVLIPKTRAGQINAATFIIGMELGMYSAEKRDQK